MWSARMMGGYMSDDKVSSESGEFENFIGQQQQVRDDNGTAE